jgi:alkylated DNA repair dioxygenase AlkB
MSVGIAIMPNLIPPLVQQILLNRLLHRDLSNPQHQTNLHLHYDISYPGDGNRHSFFSTSHSDVLFKPKDSKVHKELSMNQVLEKKLRWMTLGGQYDWTNKIYPAEEPPEFPPDVKNLISGLFRGMLDPQAAIVNIYSPGDTLSELFYFLSWESQSMPQDQNRRILEEECELLTS